MPYLQFFYSYFLRICFIPGYPYNFGYLVIVSFNFTVYDIIHIKKNRSNGKSQIKINKAPSEEEIHSFREKIWSDSKIHNSLAPWIEKLSKEYEARKEQE